MLLAGTQKAFAMPPGLTVFACSPAALAKAATVKDRGYYFDFVEFQKNAEQGMTPSTPSIGHIYALASRLDDFFAEGLDARYARHAKLAQMTRDWAARHGFNLFPEKGFESADPHLCQQRRQARRPRRGCCQAAKIGQGPGLPH